MKNNEENNQDLALLDILQAHDILLSILLGKILGESKNIGQDIEQITKMIEIQDINVGAKNHLLHLLQPLKENLATK